MTTRCLASWGVALTITVSLASAPNHSAAEPPKLRLDVQSILAVVARHMGITLRPEVPLPAIRLETATPIERFRDIVEAQWGDRPQRFSNAYVAATNEIYLIEDPDYYAATGRTLDDSLAHELVHYLQAQYAHVDLASDFPELEAVAIQNWFRSEHVRTKLVDARR